MHYLISFKTNQFDIANEEENPINPIKGKSVGNWIINLLKKDGIESTNIDAEDWGWYCYAKFQNYKYLIGFMALPSDSKDKDSEIIIQVNKHRSVIEIALGKNKITEQDSLLLTIERYIKNIRDVSNIEIIKSI